jgi:hypothetical protein
VPDVRVHAHAALHPRWAGGAGQHEVHELRPSVSRFGEVLAPNSRRPAEDETVIGKLLEKDINLYINSPGGDITSLFAIYDTMQCIKPDVSTIVMGQARRVRKPDHHAATAYSLMSPPRMGRRETEFRFPARWGGLRTAGGPSLTARCGRATRTSSSGTRCPR